MLSICYEASKQCNLHCDYCISSDNEGQGDSCENIIEKIAALKPQRVVISGGEPFLDVALLEKLKLLRQHCREAFLSLSTNGSNEYDLDHLKGLIDCIDISLPAINEDVYMQMRGKNLVKTVQKTVKTAKEKGFDVRISFILTKLNKNELFPVLDFAQEMQVNSVRIGRFLPLRNAVQYEDKYAIDVSEIEKVMKQVYKRKYSFMLIPPIVDLTAMENSYLNIDYTGRFFLPTKQGKVYLCDDEVIEKVGKQIDIFKKVQLKDKYEHLFRPLRIRRSAEERVLEDEFYSDRTRILFSPSFRRMQQKAQVFSLEKNPSVRSRLTHSIEVSDVGRRLAFRITEKLMHHDEYALKENYAASFIAIIENACLLHDIGNPPFGHFGEAAIQKWWSEKHNGYIQAYNKRADETDQRHIQFSTKECRALLKDFEEFDGNPQGLRTVLRLCVDKDIHVANLQSGLNLTYPTILCALKYVRAAGEERGGMNRSIVKKAGYFQSEKNIFARIYEDMGMLPEKGRYPLTYIMEAADDIAYGMSDIADGIEKRIITLEFFVKAFKRMWEEEYGELSKDILPDEIEQLVEEQGHLLQKDFNNLLGARWKSILIDDVAQEYTKNISQYLDGFAGALISEEQPRISWKILHIIKKISRMYIYRAPEAEEIEMAGYSIISGLLEYFGVLLTLTFEEFDLFVNPEKNPAGHHLDLEWRIFNRLSATAVDSYKRQVEELSNYYAGRIDKESIEWWLRVHLIIDHIAGMTDDYALKTYQVCKGIDISVF